MTQEMGHMEFIAHHGATLAELYNQAKVKRDNLPYTLLFENIYNHFAMAGVEVSRNVLWRAILEMDKRHRFALLGRSRPKRSPLTVAMKSFIVEQSNSEQIAPDNRPYTEEFERMHTEFMEHFGKVLSKNAYHRACVNLRKSGICGSGGKRLRNV